MNILDEFKLDQNITLLSNIIPIFCYFISPPGQHICENAGLQSIYQNLKHSFSVEIHPCLPHVINTLGVNATVLQGHPFLVAGCKTRQMAEGFQTKLVLQDVLTKRIVTHRLTVVIIVFRQQLKNINGLSLNIFKCSSFIYLFRAIYILT